jgi:hypothetical protein
VVHHDFLPFQYVDERAHSAAHWYQYLTYPLRWTGSQALLLLPALGLLALLRAPREYQRPLAVSETAAFNRRYVAALALGPFLVTTVVSAALGRLAITMWGYPLWSFAPLAILLWAPPLLEERQLRRFAMGFVAVFVAWPVIYAAVEVGEPFVRDRIKATQFPGRLLAQTVTRQWHSMSGTPLTYVIGAPLPGGAGEFAANTVSVYSPDHPHVVVHGNVNLSPWIDPADLERRGGVLLWEAARPGLPDALRRAYPRAILQPPLVLARPTFYPRPPVTVYSAILPPRP